MPSRDGYGLSEGRSRCDKKTAKGNTSGNALSFHWRKAIDEVDKEERSSLLRSWQPDHRWVWTGLGGQVPSSAGCDHLAAATSTTLPLGQPAISSSAGFAIGFAVPTFVQHRISRLD
jgi:hypothetical protein